MSKLNPPFRADHVGSLLRTPAVKENRLRWKNGEISAETLRVIENREIAAAVKRLEETGIKSITDGEFRRDYFHLDFLKQLDASRQFVDARTAVGQVGIGGQSRLNRLGRLITA